MTRKEILELAAKIEVSKTKLFGERVAIIQDEVGEKYKIDGKTTGIYIPDTSKKIEAPKRGTVLAKGTDVKVDVKPGDRVTFVIWNAGEHTVEVDGEEIRMLVLHINDIYWRWRP